MRILVECSFVFDHPHVKSGIQRVVRNVVNKLPAVSSDYEVIPVSFRGSKVLRVNQLEPQGIDRLLLPLRSKLQALNSHYWLAHGRFEGMSFFQRSHNARRALYVLMKLLGLSISLPLRLLSLPFLDYLRAEPLEVCDGDVLVLLDSSWHQSFFGPVEDLKRRGVKIISVVYDLIPILHSQFYNHTQVEVFTHWLHWTATVADGYVAISDTVRGELQTYLQREELLENKSAWFEVFYLGSELDEVAESSVIRDELQTLFDGGRNVYLTVSTIEPRKNQAYQLDAFEALWEAGSDAVLCIVGKVGWKCEALVKRIRNHKELNRRLFMFNDMGDSELQYAYSHSRALIFTSFVEGFGLPLVEAHQRGLPIFCSDIPVFREIGGDGCAYCDLADPQSLVVLVQSYEQSDVFPAGDMPDSVAISWQQSAQQLVSRVAANI